MEKNTPQNNESDDDLNKRLGKKPQSEFYRFLDQLIKKRPIGPKSRYASYIGAISTYPGIETKPSQKRRRETSPTNNPTENKKMKPGETQKPPVDGSSEIDTKNILPLGFRRTSEKKQSKQPTVISK